MARVRSKGRAARPDASSWDKLSARDHSQTLANRDVFNSQQLDRSTLGRKRSARGAFIGSAIVGVLVALVTWVLYSAIAFGVLSVGSMMGTTTGSSDSGIKPYYKQTSALGEGGKTVKCYRPLDEGGQMKGDCVSDPQSIPVPKWYTEAKAAQDAASDGKAPATKTAESTLGAQLGDVSTFKVFLTLGLGAGVALMMGSWFSRRVAAANLMSDTSDINQHDNDQHIALPEEIQRKFDWFPDAGAHSAVQVSSMISHNMLSKKGLGNVSMIKRAEKDIYDDQGNVLFYKGEALTDDHGEPIRESLPLIDEGFGEDLFEASGLPNDKKLRKTFDTTVIPYNPDGKDRDKLGKYKMVSDLIKADWELPDYEVQRPAGAYNVDTAPVNTMVLAITRAGKGQTYIEPLLDMWSREKNPSNIVVNDPKGELLVKNYIPFVTRGYEVLQFNLINATKTDIYNPLGVAAEAAREGNTTKCAQYVDSIANVFFPLEGGEDPVWPNAARNAFKRAAYGLIDFYLEEERELREYAANVGMDPETLDQRLDDMWGKVTLYNCYQLFVQLASTKLKNPEAELEKRVKAGEFDDDQDALEIEKEAAAKQAFLWEGKPEQDMLSLYYTATEVLPKSTMRDMVSNAHNSLRSMAGAEKMLASVYGIAITAMSFFTDPTISTLTSGKPSQNADLGGLSFPRRIGVRFSQDFLKRDHLIGKQAVWSAYEDSMFTKNLGKDFEHSDIVSREGWARYYFKGIFPNDIAYLKLELVNPSTKLLIRTYYFEFRKSYQLSLNGRHYVTEKVTGKKIVKNGILREMMPKREGDMRDGQILSFAPGSSTFPHDRLIPEGAGWTKRAGKSRTIIQTMVRYSEAPKAVFLVTPPHLMNYAKLLLILIKQLVDFNFDQSYMTKSNQKPLYRTRFMLDELGNLQSDGKGIQDFSTMLSIGLGQEQQFTLILQTLQQLRDVYGDSSDKIVQGNAQPLTAKIATPTGWTTMGEVAVGDAVLTPDGGTTHITGVYPRGTRPVYRVTRRNGATTEACNEHLWEVIVTPPSGTNAFAQSLDV